MKNKMKKAQLDSAILWPLAVFIIMFILFWFMVVGISWAGVKGKEEIKISGFQNEKALIESYSAFLESKIMVSEKEVLVKDLIKGEPDENKEEFEMFRQLAFDFLKENKLDGWVRVYGLDEEISKYSSGKYKQYGSSVDFFISPDRPSAVKSEDDVCDPSDESNELFYVINENKKMVVCVQAFKKP